jgi:hypothetical protein
LLLRIGHLMIVQSWNTVAAIGPTALDAVASGHRRIVTCLADYNCCVGCSSAALAALAAGQVLRIVKAASCAHDAVRAAGAKL